MSELFPEPGPPVTTKKRFSVSPNRNLPFSGSSGMDDKIVNHARSRSMPQALDWPSDCGRQNRRAPTRQARKGRRRRNRDLDSLFPLFPLRLLQFASGAWTDVLGRKTSAKALHAAE